MLNSYDAFLLRASYGFLSSRKFDNYLRECHALYRQVWAAAEKLVPVPKWGGITDSQDPDWEAKCQAHNDALAIRAMAVKAEVLRMLNNLASKGFAMANAVVHHVVAEYWRDNARHYWQAIQTQGAGKIELGMLRRHEALHALSIASTESNVIYIDDIHHFLLFKTPAAK